MTFHPGDIRLRLIQEIQSRGSIFPTNTAAAEKNKLKDSNRGDVCARGLGSMSGLADTALEVDLITHRRSLTLQAGATAGSKV